MKLIVFSATGIGPRSTAIVTPAVESQLFVGVSKADNMIAFYDVELSPFRVTFAFETPGILVAMSPSGANTYDVITGNVGSYRLREVNSLQRTITAGRALQGTGTRRILNTFRGRTNDVIGVFGETATGTRKFLATILRSDGTFRRRTDQDNGTSDPITTANWQSVIESNGNYLAILEDGSIASFRFSASVEADYSYRTEPATIFTVEEPDMTTRTERFLASDGSGITVGATFALQYIDNGADTRIVAIDSEGRVLFYAAGVSGIPDIGGGFAAYVGGQNSRLVQQLIRRSEDRDDDRVQARFIPRRAGTAIIPRVI